MNKILYALVIILCQCKLVFASVSAELEAELKRQCDISIEIIEHNDAERFISLLPNQDIDQNERKQIVRYVDKRHRKYMVKSDGWLELKFDKVVMRGDLSKYGERYQAKSVAIAYYHMTMNNEKKTKRHAQCQLIQVGESWHLVKLL